MPKYINSGEVITLFGSTASIASAAEAFAQFAPHTTARRLFVSQELRFAFATEAFLARFHGTVAGSDGHGANLGAVAALLTELRPDAEGVLHMAVLSPADKADGSGFPDLCADPHTASA